MIGGGDNPVFLRKLAAWMDALHASGPASLAYHSCFWSQPVNEGVHEFAELPKAAAAYLELFGNPEKSNGRVPAMGPEAATRPAS